MLDTETPVILGRDIVEFFAKLQEKYHADLINSCAIGVIFARMAHMMGDEQAKIVINELINSIKNTKSGTIH